MRKPWILALRCSAPPTPGAPSSENCSPSAAFPVPAATFSPALHAGELSQSHLTLRIGLSKQAVQQALDGLEASGHVRRENDPLDRRAKRVMLTELGQRALDAQRAAARELEQRYSARLGRKTFKKLRKILPTLAR